MRIAHRFFLLFLVCISLSGCVWLRMLELKAQLSHFDENFKVDSSRNFSLHFLNPVLFSDDYLTLAKVQPSEKEAAPDGKRWRQVFSKINAAGQKETGADVVFTLQFDHNDRLTSWDFSPVFLAMIPPKFLEASLRSLGKGNVDRGKQQLRVNAEDLPKVDAKPPNRDQILSILGEPAEKTLENGLKLHIYRFRADTPATESGYEDRRNASAKLFYDPKTNELQKVTARFLGLKFSVDFRKMLQLEALEKGESA